MFLANCWPSCSDIPPLSPTLTGILIVSLTPEPHLPDVIWRLRFIPVCTGNTLGSTDEHVGATVYPCMYREHTTISIVTIAFFGLSLCVQGTLDSPGGEVTGTRFIPVHTGNTPPAIFLSSGRSVYPCAYREHYLTLVRVGGRAGLSLCIQGTQRGNQYDKKTDRFIPVHTGNTSILIPTLFHLLGLSLCIQGTRQL